MHSTFQGQSKVTVNWFPILLGLLLISAMADRDIARVSTIDSIIFFIFGFVFRIILQSAQFFNKNEIILEKLRKP